MQTKKFLFVFLRVLFFLYLEILGTPDYFGLVSVNEICDFYNVNVDRSVLIPLSN